MERGIQVWSRKRSDDYYFSVSPNDGAMKEIILKINASEKFECLR